MVVVFEESSSELFVVLTLVMKEEMKEVIRDGRAGR